MGKRTAVVTIETIKEKTVVKNDCWIWQGGFHSQGYPMTRYNKKMNLVSRVLVQDGLDYELTKQHRVKNKCGEKSCVNPDHYHILVPSDEKYSTAWDKHSHSREQAAAWKAEFDSTPPKYGKNSKMARREGIHENVMARIVQGRYYIDRPDKKDDPQ